MYYRCQDFQLMMTKCVLLKTHGSIHDYIKCCFAIQFGHFCAKLKRKMGQSSQCCHELTPPPYFPLISSHYISLQLYFHFLDPNYLSIHLQACSNLLYSSHNSSLLLSSTIFFSLYSPITPHIFRQILPPCNHNKFYEGSTRLHTQGLRRWRSLFGYAKRTKKSISVGQSKL